MTEFTEFTEVASELPGSVHEGEPGQCLRNSIWVAKVNGLRYAEGIAKGYLGFWYRHAWNLDESGRVVDVTWDEPGARYIGRVIDAAEKWDRVVELGHYVFEHEQPLVPDDEIGIDCYGQREIDWLRQARQRE